MRALAHWIIKSRLVESMATLALLVCLTFVLAHAMPGGPAYSILGQKATPAGVSAVNLELGLQVPVWRQFGVWWLHLAHGDLGTSYLLNRPVSAVIGAYAGNSLVLCAAGLVLGVGLAVAAGLVIGASAGVSASVSLVWASRLLDRLATALYAMPGFFLGSVLLLVFSVWWPVLPGGGVADARLAAPSLGDMLAHLVLPAVTLALLIFPAPAQLFGQAVAAELALPYARAAAAKGLSPLQVLWRHVTPNALRPLVGWVGVALPGVLAGAVVVETVFDYPGLGWLLWRSAVGHDYPVLVGVVLVLGVVTVVGNFAADAVLAWLDPRSVPTTGTPAKIPVSDKHEPSPLFSMGPLALWHFLPFAIGAGVLLGPGPGHPLGTDALGRDVLSRLIEGGGSTLGVALPAAALAWGVAVAYGLAAAAAPRWLAAVMLRLLDAVLALPGLVVLLVFAALLPPGWTALVLLIGLTFWPGLARLVHNEAVALRGRDFVLASRQLGAGWRWIARVHLLPAMAGFLAVNAGLLVADAVLGLSALSFLGLGVQPPSSSWGQMLQQGLDLVDLGAWWLILPPGLAIVATVLAARGLGARLARR